MLDYNPKDAGLWYELGEFYRNLNITQGYQGKTIDEIFETKALVDRLREYPNVSISGPICGT